MGWENKVVRVVVVAVQDTHLFGACLGWRGSRKGRTLSGYRILRPELSKVDAKNARELALMEAPWKLASGCDLSGVCAISRCAGGQTRQDGTLRHLQPLSHWRDASQGGRKPADVRLHV